jgi:methylenetetrahydrofolate reductase (NADPH)
LGLAEENAAVLCVTGDHPASGHRPDAAGVFDLDSTELAALARATGIEVVAVAGSPGVEPTAIRPGRLAQKALAGAQVCFINNANEPQDVVDYIRSCLACGADGVAFIVCIPVLATASSRTMTSSFANFRAPALSNDPIESALLHARAMLDCDGVGGVHLEAHGAPHEIDEAISAVMKVAGEIG